VISYSGGTRGLKSTNADKLKAAIQHEIAAIPPEMAREVMWNFRVRLQMCIENAIFKKRQKKVNIVLSDCQIKL
jgi:hypothetical protein